MCKNGPGREEAVTSKYVPSEDANSLVDPRKHVAEYHGVNSSDYVHKAGGSKECVSKIIYRRDTSSWHARIVS